MLLGVFVPLPFALAHLKDGFVATTNPTLFCIGRNGDTVFYTLVLPISIFMAAGTCMMTLLFCHIIKVSSIAPRGQYHPPPPPLPSYHSTPYPGPMHAHTQACTCRNAGERCEFDTSSEVLVGEHQARHQTQLHCLLLHLCGRCWAGLADVLWCKQQLGHPNSDGTLSL